MKKNMKKNIKKIIITCLLLTIAGLGSIGCTENQRAKNLGGTMRVKIPSNEIFVNATWKESQLWYLTRPRLEGETNKFIYTFQEDSNFGLIEGKVLFSEQ